MGYWGLEPLNLGVGSCTGHVYRCALPQTWGAAAVTTYL